MNFSRRGFLAAAIASPLWSAMRKPGANPEANQATPLTLKRPIIVSAGNGYNYLDQGYEILQRGGDTLDAVMQVIQGPENDPKDDSVGLGGLPNEEGVVELDACCMHGPTRRAGAVGGVRNIKNVSLVAKAVMEHTGHVMLVGEGAERFAVARGFPRENLLTEHSRQIGLLWKEYHSHDDWWGPGLSDPNAPAPIGERWRRRLQDLEAMADKLGIEPEFRRAAIHRVLFPPTGTIHCSALNDKSEMSGATTTSGLSFKLAGRVGDSPIIGAGCYTDQDVGSAGATGSGEENIKVAGAHTIVENMRRGMSPQEAGMDALKRIVRNYNGDMKKLRFMDMTYYILRKDGAYAGVSLWDGYTPDPWDTGPPAPHRIAIHDGSRRLEKTVALFQGKSLSYPPLPHVPEQLWKEAGAAK